MWVFFKSILVWNKMWRYLLFSRLSKYLFAQPHIYWFVLTHGCCVITTNVANNYSTINLLSNDWFLGARWAYCDQNDPYEIPIQNKLHSWVPYIFAIIVNWQVGSSNTGLFIMCYLYVYLWCHSTWRHIWVNLRMLFTFYEWNSWRSNLLWTTFMM